MSDSKYLYIVKNIADNRVQLVTEIEEEEGVILSEGKICAVLKRYAPPIDMNIVMLDMQKFIDFNAPIEKKAKNKSSKTFLLNALN